MTEPIALRVNRTIRSRRPHVRRMGVWVDAPLPWVVLHAGLERFHRTFRDAITDAHDIATRGGAS